MSAPEASSEPPTKKFKPNNLVGTAATVDHQTSSSVTGVSENHPTLIAQPTTSTSVKEPRPSVPSVVPSTSGNLRLALHNTQSILSNESLQKLSSTDINQTRPQLHLSSPTIAFPIQQNQTSDGVVTLQFPGPVTGKVAQPKSPVTFSNVIVSNISTRHTQPQIVTIQNNRLTSPTSILSKPLVSADVKGQLPVLGKHGPSSDQGKVGSSTQISFQVPLNWNMAGSKSLLDTSGGKMSIVAFNSAEGKSLLGDKKNVTIDAAQSLGAVVDNKTVVTVKKNDNTSKNLVAGGKVFTTIPGQVLSSTALYSVPRNTSAINTTSKQGSFVISNKQYTIVPGSSSQILKTDTSGSKLSKAKITMAEAQIMLPSGPAKISWPIQQQQLCTTINDSGSKQILITAPLLKAGQSLPTGKSVITSKPVVTTNTPHTTMQIPKMAATAKVVELVTSGKSNGIHTKTLGIVTNSNNKPLSNAGGNNGNGAKTPTSNKPAVLPVQKSWELVKQASQLIPTVRSDKTPSTTPSEIKVEPSTTESNTAEIIHPPLVGQSLLTNEEVKIPTEDVTCVQNVAIVTKPKTDDRTSEEMSVTVESSIKDDKENMPTVKLESATPEGVQERMETSDMPVLDLKIEPDDADASQDNFDPVKLLEWKDGIGELPGSNLKFRVNDLGVLDVIAHDLECNETLNTSNESESAEPSQMEVNDVDEDTKEPNDVDEQAKKKEASQQEVSNKDEITQCENCGEYGFATDFYKEGKFCSQTCVGAYESKRMRGVKKQGTMSKALLDLKKGHKKKLLLKDSMNKDNPDAGSKKSKAFVWTRYLEKENATEAPARLFRNPFPATKNMFRVGMKLEGVDPHHHSLFCVLSVVEVCGYRIRLHFDGYSECFDFWSDIDSPYIYPMGFCEKNNKILQPPKGFFVESFNWTSYLKLTKGIPAPKSIFSNQPVQPVTPNLFRVGSKLEAVDKKNSSLICVASVADTLGDKVLIHFDSWDDNYDYWCDMTAPYIHPCGYCEGKGYILSPPIDWKDPNGFTWERFLAKMKCQAVPARAFKSRPMVGFEPGMKVEVVDKRNPLLVRVATIMEVENYLVKIHFDGWSDTYDYWLDDDSPEIHPPGWCAKTGHPLVPPIGAADLVVTSGPGVCPTPGCKGIGHIKGPKYSGHHSTFGCPYSEINMNKEGILGDRLASYIRSEDGVGPHYRAVESSEQKTNANNDGSNHATKTVPPLKLINYSKLNSQENGIAPKKFGRGRRPKSYYLELEAQRQRKEKEKEREEKEETLRQGIHNSVFSSAMVSTPKTEVPLCWDQHSKLLPGVTNIRGNDVSKWTIEEVASFVNTLPGCEEQAKLFQEQQIDGEAFLLLNQSDIVKIMNIKLGPALKIFNSIIMFKISREV